MKRSEKLPVWFIEGTKLFNLNSRNDIKYSDNQEYYRKPLPSEKIVAYIPKKPRLKEFS